MKKYFWNLFVSIDQFANTVFGGDPDETISSRVGKYQHIWICRVVSKFLDWIDPNHTEKSIEHDEGDDAVLK